MSPILILAPGCKIGYLTHCIYREILAHPYIPLLRNNASKGIFPLELAIWIPTFPCTGSLISTTSGNIVKYSLKVSTSPAIKWKYKL
jgi:hypothetical protein